MLIRRAKIGPKALFWANFGKFLKHYLLILRVSRIIYSFNYGRILDVIELNGLKKIMSGYMYTTSSHVGRAMHGTTKNTKVTGNTDEL